MQSDSPVVLIVDDDQDSREMYMTGLSGMGFQPRGVATADEAFARACDVPADVVVADISLPGVSGVDLTRRLRHDARTRHAGIVVLTGHAYGSTQEQEARQAGCDRYLVKPCLPDALALEIHNVLASRQQGSTVFSVADLPFHELRRPD
jgi:DNA-binding response OmpR family regulator